MTLLLAGRRRGAMPVAPYNAATYLTIPTPDGTGKTTHPSVIDMGAGGWNGYRWWMAHTPYAGNDVSLENPCIVASNDRVTWVEPTGITNPIDPWPGGSGYNSDTDLIYDPDSGKMVCYWRDYLGDTAPGSLIFCYSESSDGVTWTPQANALTLQYPSPTDGGIFSPAILRVGSADWRMWNVGYKAGGGVAHSDVYHASSYAGPWTDPQPLTFNGTVDAGLTNGLWHWDITQHGGTLYGLVISNQSTTAAKIYAITSTNGVAWSVNVEPVIENVGGWDAWLYRPTLTVEGALAHVWYSAKGAADWRIGYTRIPLSEWPAPPA